MTGTAMIFSIASTSCTFVITQLQASQAAAADVDEVAPRWGELVPHMYAPRVRGRLTATVGAGPERPPPAHTDAQA